MPPFILLPIRVGATRLATYLTLSIPRRFYIGQLIPFVRSFLDVERPCQLIELQQRRAKSSCSLSFFKTANLCVYIYIYIHSPPLLFPFPTLDTILSFVESSFNYLFPLERISSSIMIFIFENRRTIYRVDSVDGDR